MRALALAIPLAATAASARADYECYPQPRDMASALPVLPVTSIPMRAAATLCPGASPRALTSLIVEDTTFCGFSRPVLWKQGDRPDAPAPVHPLAAPLVLKPECGGLRPMPVLTVPCSAELGFMDNCGGVQ